MPRTRSSPRATGHPGQRGVQRGRRPDRRHNHSARPGRGPDRDLPPDGGPLRQRGRRVDDRRGTAARTGRRHRERTVGLRGSALRLRLRARALGDYLHRIRPGRTGRLPRDDDGLPKCPPARNHPAGRRQERGAASVPGRRQVDPVPSSEDRVRRLTWRDPALTLARPPQLERSRAGAPAAERVPGGTRSASVSGPRRSRRSTAGS